MKIKHVESSYVFEADDEAARELVARGDYEKAAKADEVPPVATPKRKTKR